MTNTQLADKLAIIDELSKAYQRIVSVNKDVNNSKVDTSVGKILDKINDVVDSIKKLEDK